MSKKLFSFLSAFNDFKTFIYKSYNAKLAEYPVSNIQSVKVKIYEVEELIKDLDKISKLKFSDGLDFDNALFTVTDNTVVKTTDLMTWLEKEFGKEITSRTWLTIHRILKKMQ